MGKIYTIDEIRTLVKPIAERYGIEKVLLFGSYARGEATESSDVDLLISYNNLKGMFAIGGVYSDFEKPSVTLILCLKKPLPPIMQPSGQENFF